MCDTMGNTQNNKASHFCQTQDEMKIRESRKIFDYLGKCKGVHLCFILRICWNVCIFTVASAWMPRHCFPQPLSPTLVGESQGFSSQTRYIISLACRGSSSQMDMPVSPIQKYEKFARCLNHISLLLSVKETVSLLWILLGGLGSPYISRMDRDSLQKKNNLSCLYFHCHSFSHYLTAPDPRWGLKCGRTFEV